LSSSLSTLAHHLGRFISTNTSTPLTTSLIIFVREVCLSSADESSQLTLIITLHLLQGNNGGRLLVHNGTKTSLAFDDNVRDTHLAAEGGQKDDELNRVNIVCDSNKSCLLGLNESNDVVKAVFDEQRLLILLFFLVLSGGSGSSKKTGLLLLLSLGTVLVEQFEKLGGRVLVESVRKLSDGRRNLQTLMQDDLLMPTIRAWCYSAQYAARGACL